MTHVTRTLSVVRSSDLLSLSRVVVMALRPGHRPGADNSEWECVIVVWDDAPAWYRQGQHETFWLNDEWSVISAAAAAHESILR